MAELPRDCSSRKFLVLFQNDFGIPSIRMVTSKTPICISAVQDTLGTIGAILMCILPTILICIVLALSTLKVFLVSIGAVVIGLVMQPCLKYVERKRWIKFSISSDLPDLHGSNQASNEALID